MKRVVALAGNPNSGKTTVFNRLTGLNQRVGNYPGVTVERRAGAMTVGRERYPLIDLPGTYSLISRSRDEAIAFEVITGRGGEERPDLTVIVLDASNLDRNLYLALSILELGAPALIALNMIDLAEELGMKPDPMRLSAELGVPVVPICAKDGTGMDLLRAEIARALEHPPIPRPRRWRLSEVEEAAIEAVRQAVPPRAARPSTLPSAPTTTATAVAPGDTAEAQAVLSAVHGVHGPMGPTDGEALWLLTTLAVADHAASGDSDDPLADSRAELERALALARETLKEAGSDFAARVIRARYEVAVAIAEVSLERAAVAPRTKTDRIDAVLLHPVLGSLVFLLVMALLFQSIFAWAEPLTALIERGIAAIQGAVASVLPAGALADLLADGVLGGVGSVVVFIPQIAILFAFIAILEDSGYLARAAFITDRLMARVGLHGRAFVPLLSGFACAIPAIMATRTIESKKDRLVTILVTPLMSCSARLPVYGVVIGAFFATRPPLFGFISVGGLLMLAMYALSVTMAILAAFVLKRTILKSPTPPFVLELPPYRRPVFSSVGRRVYERCAVFIRDAGTIILACSIVLWGLLYFPRPSGPTPEVEAAQTAIEETLEGDARETALARLDGQLRAERLASSYAGRLGHALEPVIAPLGFDWKIGIGLLASFAAREVLVSTLGLVYGVGADADEESVPLREALRKERDPATGAPLYTPLTGLALMVFFVLACQCMSTVAVVKRETASWRWPAFLVAYMTVLAWIGAFVVYQGGRALGFG